VVLVSSLRPALLRMNELSPLSNRLPRRGDRAFLFGDEKLRENGRYAGLKRFLQPI